MPTDLAPAAPRRARQIARRVTAAIARFRPAAIPLFSHASGRPELIGTGVGVAAGERRLVLTATHVLRHFADDSIRVPLPSGWRTLTGTALFAATPGTTDPDDDFVDAGILVLDTGSAGNWHSWLAPADLLPGSLATPADRFVMVGFPRSRVKYHLDDHAVSPRAVRYLGAGVPASRYRAVLARPDIHIAIDYRRREILQDGQIETPPRLYGTSGGMLIRTPGISTGGSIAENRLAGIFIEEYGAPHHLLVSTRIDVHLALIHDRMPDLRGFFPRPRSVRPRQRWGRR
jgi:hypothetical protein